VRIAIQHRMAYQESTSLTATGEGGRRTPPIAHMLKMDIPVAGTDATRVRATTLGLPALAGHGRTVGGLSLYPEANRLDRERALRL